MEENLTVVIPMSMSEGMKVRFDPNIDRPYFILPTQQSNNNPLPLILGFGGLILLLRLWKGGDD